MKTIFETRRFKLREISEQDVDGLFEMDSDPDVMKYLGNNPAKDKEKYTKKILSHIQNQYKAHGIGRLAIIDKKTQEFIGWSGLKFEQNLRTEFDYYDLGYRLLKKHWGKGIGTEVAAASLLYGFQVLNLNKICAAADVDNIASNKILKKVGLKFKETFQFDGVEHNWYELERTNWIPSI